MQQIAQRLASKEVAAQAAQLEERYQYLLIQFNASKNRFRALQLHYRALQNQLYAVQQEQQWLQHVACTKQQVIDVLLPYYPHPLTPELQLAIESY